MKFSRNIGFASFTLIMVAAGWYFASPIWALKQMRNAANANDSEALSRYVDFPALREDLKSELSAAMIAKAKTDKSGMGALGMAFGMALADKMIDGLVSPAGVRVMFAANDANGTAKAPSAIRAGGDDIQIERKGMSEFRVFQQGDSNKGAMVFHRDGFSWKLVVIDLPPNGITSGK